MAKLRPHVDAFFDKVTVNVDDKPMRENRLRLLNEIREATRAVADFSRIEGCSGFRLSAATARQSLSGSPNGTHTSGVRRSALMAADCGA